MVARVIQYEDPLHGSDEFIYFINAVRDAKKGDEEVVNLFKSLHLDFEHQHVISLFGLLLSRAPLSHDQAMALKRILEIGGK
jgi:hypothetical protein